MPLRAHADALETLYRRYNCRQYVHPDPLELVLAYGDPADREVAAALASALAYGRVGLILRSAGEALCRMPPSPAAFVRGATPAAMRRAFAGFRHRFARGEHVAALLWGLGRICRRHGSLRRCFLGGLRRGDETVLPALRAFAGELSAEAEGACGHLLPDPGRGSACKRLNLFLRWLVRRDEVDPGGWGGVPASMLIVPLDVHMHRLCRRLGATQRAAADLRTALEVTAAFRRICPDDPVRYDFSLTRLGIRRNLNAPHGLERLGALE